MRHNFIYNNTNRKEQRRYLRKRMTDIELMLWSEIRNKKLGYTFRRQYSIGPYIVDFYCPKKRFVIELDGSQHMVSQDYDSYRTNYLNALDIKVLRFWNQEVEIEIDKVLEKIKKFLSSPSKVEGD